MKRGERQNRTAVFAFFFAFFEDTVDVTWATAVCQFRAHDFSLPFFLINTLIVIFSGLGFDVKVFLN